MRIWAGRERGIGTGRARIGRLRVAGTRCWNGAYEIADTVDAAWIGCKTTSCPHREERGGIRSYHYEGLVDLSNLDRMLTCTTAGPQDHPPLGSSGDPPARYRPDPPRWSLPRQARRSPEDSRPGCPSRHRPLQDQRCSPPPRQRSLRHRHITEGRPRRSRREED